MPIADADPVKLDGTTFWSNAAYSPAAVTDLYPITFLAGFVQPVGGGARKLMTFSAGSTQHYLMVQVSDTAGDPGAEQFSFSVETDAGAGAAETIAANLDADTAYMVMVSILNSTTWIASVNGSPLTLTGTMRTTGSAVSQLNLFADRAGAAMFTGHAAVLGVWHDASNITQTETNNVTDGTTDPREINTTFDASIQYLLGFEGTTLTAYAGNAGDFTQTGTGITEPGTYDAAFAALGWPPGGGGGVVQPQIVPPLPMRIRRYTGRYMRTVAGLLVPRPGILLPA